jgi:hypothetical protein
MNYPTEAEIEVKDIIYQSNSQGFFDTVSGKFVVHVLRDHKETELVITFFKCPKGSTGYCTEDGKDFVEAVDCKRFLKDATGPWHIFAPAVDKRNVCAETKGEFNIKGAKLEARFIEKYMVIEEGHYRIRFIHHLPHESMDIKNLRACVELDFDIVM